MWLSSASMLAEVGSRLKPEWSHSCRNTKPNCGRQDSRDPFQTLQVSHIIHSRLIDTDLSFTSRPLSAATGGDSIPAMTDAVKEAARKELEARTGETESNSDA